ncbi:integrase/recombinase XerD [Thermosporothrix hazakensis]|jgi:integrase/recombinase XerD|uniref:Integrase/recombinase XerD n=1 Tax=Thermosporothrix hazakensis TaxID=644383 RepID=A0A326TZE4_THEHA|nr:tyrosine-type recombinase/integrase [Thermosporothrix hazakensis]PZW22938.1 integrase/recombinase XerD [Thermosporothrix hazakensis]GCE48251.1 integrase [Thermosporothrix hazakensis]
MKIEKAIKGYIIDCRTRGRSYRTIEWYEQKLRVFADWMREEEEIEELEEVSTLHLRAFVLHIQSIQVGRPTVNKNGDPSEISPLTVKGYVQVVKGFFNWCYQEELIEKNPGARLQLPKVPEYVIPTFSSEHIRMMLAVCDTSTALGYRDYTIVLLLLETGVRISELCNLRMQDVHEDYIKVNGKGKKEREIGISAGVSKCLWKYINKYRKARDEKEDRVFINRAGVPLTPTGVDQVLDDLKERAGITGVRVSAHTFRHTFARMYLEQGGDLYKLSLLMGHSDVEVTQEYLKDFKKREARREQDRFSAVNALGVLNGRRRKKRSDL